MQVVFETPKELDQVTSEIIDIRAHRLKRKLKDSETKKLESLVAKKDLINKKLSKKRTTEINQIKSALIKHTKDILNDFSVISLECESKLVHSYQLTYGKTRKIAWYLKAIPFLFAGILGWCFAADILTLLELGIFYCLTFALSELLMKDQGWIIEEQKPCN